jgi:gluconolactonase
MWYKPGMRSAFASGLASLLLAVACRTAVPSVAPAAAPRGPDLATAAQAIPSDLPFESLEGPFWVAKRGYLIFSDVVEQNGPAAKIYRFDPATRAFAVVDYPGAPISTNGLAVDGEGRLVACERWNGSLARVEGGTRTVLADRSPAGATLNAPNDLAVRGDGNIYFTDSTWGARPGAHAPTAMYRLSPAGLLSVAFSTDMPNGIVLSPDGRALYVGSDAHDRLWRLPLAEDGSVGQAQPFADGNLSPAGRLHVPDGLCVDQEGRVYVANNSAEASAILVLAPDGRFVGRIPVPSPPSNCTFGGADRRTLYITTRHAIFEAQTDTPGLP